MNENSKIGLRNSFDQDVYIERVIFLKPLRTKILTELQKCSYTSCMICYMVFYDDFHYKFVVRYLRSDISYLYITYL